MTRLNTPGVMYKDLLIIGGLISETMAGGIRAFDVRTGELKWVFHTIPASGRVRLRHVAARCVEDGRRRVRLVGPSVDEARGIVYVSTETAGPDFWGGDRYGANLFANSLVALDANTGRRLWHYQIVHHDLWDLDLPAPADAAHGHAQRAADRCRRAGHEARAAVRLRSRHRPAALAGSRTADAPRRRFPELTDLADAAGAGEAGAADAAALHRRTTCRTISPMRAR